MANQPEREQQILEWQIEDRRKAAVAGIQDAVDRLHRMAEDVVASQKVYPNPADLSKALAHAQNTIVWGFANLLSAINDAAAKAHQADALTSTLAALTGAAKK